MAELCFPASAVAQVDRLSEENPDLSQSFALLVNDMLNDFPVPEYRDQIQKDFLWQLST